MWCDGRCSHRPFDASFDDDRVSNDNCSIPVTMDAIPVLQHSMVNTICSNFSYE